jgi:anti-anti-sigma factor
MSDEPISEFSIEEQRWDGQVMITVRGDLDLASADQVGARLATLREAGEPALLNLDELDFMDSSGLRMVLDAAEASDATGWRFSLTHGTQQVQRLFESTRVTERLPIVQRPDAP